MRVSGHFSRVSIGGPKTTNRFIKRIDLALTKLGKADLSRILKGAMQRKQRSPKHETPINVYGDILIPTSGTHGVDIASQRFDELDRAAAEFAVGKTSTDGVALDLGCGSGIQGLRFALLGWHTHLYDLLDLAESVARLASDFSLPVVFHQADLTNADLKLASPAQIIFSQRFLHYLRFDDANQLIGRIREAAASGAKLFISASGLDSELRDGYLSATLPVRERFGPLSPAMQDRHDIREPVCLYTEAEFLHLITQNGFERERVWSSPFGNVKGIFRVP